MLSSLPYAEKSGVSWACLFVGSTLEGQGRLNRSIWINGCEFSREIVR